jgi:putative phosphoesterase
MDPSRETELAPLTPVPARRFGVISDTHGFLDPRIPLLFAGVEHIFHGGDIGREAVIRELEAVAPVTAVLGNTDAGLDYRETESVELAGRKFLLQHIVDVHSPYERLARRIARERPDAVIFGHTHKPFSEAREGTLYLNPGYAGKPRFGMPRSVALLEYTPPRFSVAFVPLDDQAAPADSRR